MTLSKEYAEIGNKIIESTLPKLMDVSIAYLTSSEEKKKATKLICGECIKVNQKTYGWCCPFDFLIVVYENNIAYFNDEQKEILIEHELMHIGIDEVNGNETKYYIVPHDIEDFNEIIEKYGMRWNDAERRQSEQ